MPDEATQTTELTTTPTTVVQGNQPEARNPDGSIKDQQNRQSTPTDQSATQDKKSDSLAAKPAEGEKPAEPVIPEKYDFKAPEGYEVNQELIDKATPILKELKIDQDGAAKLFDVVATEVAKAQTEMVDFYENLRSDWRKEIVADKDIGNGKDGLAPEASQNIAAAIGSLPTELQQSFKDAMNLTGAGDNPAFVRAMSILGKNFREGTHVKGGQPSPLGQRSPNAGPVSPAQAMFPSLRSADSGS